MKDIIRFTKNLSCRLEFTQKINLPTTAKVIKNKFDQIQSSSISSLVSKNKRLKFDYTYSVERSVLRFLGIKRVKNIINLGELSGEPDAIDFDTKKVIEVKTTRLNVESYSSPVMEVLMKGSLQVLMYSALVVLKGVLNYAIPSLVIAHFSLVDDRRAVVTRIFEFRPMYYEVDVITKDLAEKIANEYFKKSSSIL
ncbi:hypothetical protein [Stygiolobus caldivivus]|uniref:Uncharacterized protein n=1 Tax=Stygiolobus caldivivus TaxID=2824673 RepID=A0A8D5ZIX0_9CREN|nr:hypothetical protein [Stygiolobus caldivivus]BCU69647.1 hypothetical protein KN1_09440 [Stygiolobus caldivivus]